MPLLTINSLPQLLKKRPFNGSKIGAMWKGRMSE
jgi:hypothetical protein